MEKSKEQIREELAKFDLSKREDCPNEVVHAKKHIIRFIWRNRDVDLRTAPAVVLELAAKADDCTVLNWKDKPAPSSGGKGGGDSSGKK